MQITIPAKYRTIFYWATFVTTVASALVMGIGAALGLVEVSAVEKGVVVAGMIMGILSPILALFNIKPDSE